MIAVYKRQMVGFKGGVAVKPVDAGHILPHDFIEHAPFAEHAGHGTAEAGPQDEGEALHIDGQLELVRFVHTDAVVVAGGEFGQKAGPEAHAVSYTHLSAANTSARTVFAAIAAITTAARSSRRKPKWFVSGLSLIHIW